MLTVKALEELRDERRADYLAEERREAALRAAAIQQAREAADLARHIERVQWLQGSAPQWACGTPVDAGTRRLLLEQSRAYIAQTTPA